MFILHYTILYYNIPYYGKVYYNIIHTILYIIFGSFCLCRPLEPLSAAQKPLTHLGEGRFCRVHTRWVSFHLSKATLKAWEPVVNLVVPCWVLSIIGHRAFSGPDPKGDHNFDNHPCKIMASWARFRSFFHVLSGS